MISTKKMDFKMFSPYQPYFILNHSVRCSYNDEERVHKTATS